jgi:hypothetical protein
MYVILPFPGLLAGGARTKDVLSYTYLGLWVRQT